MFWPHVGWILALEYTTGSKPGCEGAGCAKAERSRFNNKVTS